MRHPRVHTLMLLPLILALAPAAALAAEQPAAAETQAQVPALSEMHEVIFPLWHEAWPNKNYPMMKDLLPQVQGHVKKVQAAELPGILRDRKAAWDEGVKSLAEATARYEKAVAANDEKGMLDAVEALHSRYEGLVRVVRPAMKELDAYHVELYKVYHHLMPAKDIAGVRAASEEMLKRCQALTAAPVPKRFAARETEIRAEFGALCTATSGLREAAGGQDADRVSVAVEAVHKQYQKTEKLFE